MSAPTSAPAASLPRVVHALPGRVRLHVPQAAGGDVESLADRLARLPGVAAVSASRYTGNVLVAFDPARVDAPGLLAAAARWRPGAPEGVRGGPGVAVPEAAQARRVALRYAPDVVMVVTAMGAAFTSPWGMAHAAAEVLRFGRDLVMEERLSAAHPAARRGARGRGRGVPRLRPAVCGGRGMTATRATVAAALLVAGPLARPVAAQLAAQLAAHDAASARAGRHGAVVGTVLDSATGRPIPEA